MAPLIISDLPPPPPGKTGWPWTSLSMPSFPGDPLGGESLTGDAPWPRITIVTPSYNQGEFIEETIRSVLLQGYPNLEYFIYDGGSTDLTVEVIRKYSPWVTAWVSAPDGGQTDAISKGFEKASGVLLGWINSDDMLLPGAMFTAARLHNVSPGSLIAGSVLNFNSDSGYKQIVKPKNITLPAALRLWERSMVWHQPGMFFPRKSYQLAGGLDISLRYTMDHDLLCRLLRMDTQVVYTDHVLACFRLHANSKTISENTHLAVEAYKTTSKYWPLLGDSFYYYAFRMFIHFFLRAAKALVYGNWRIALQSIKSGARLFFEYIKDIEHSHAKH